MQSELNNGHDSSTNPSHDENGHSRQSEENKSALNQNPSSSLNKPNKGSAFTKSALTGAIKKNSGNDIAPGSEGSKSTQDPTVVMTKYTAHWMNKQEDEKVYKVFVELPHLETVFETLRDVLPLLNQRLEEENSAYKLAEDPTQYDLYQAKKTGKPKFDFPALDSGQILKDTGVQAISIVEKNQKAVTLRTCNTGVVNNTNEAPNNSSMVDTTMPIGQSTNSVRLEEDYVIQTYCCCFKVRKAVPRKNNATNVSMQEIHGQNLNSSLLDRD